MPDHNWDDQKIEKLLKQTPNIIDYRSKSEILSQLKQDDRLQNMKKKKSASRWIPGAVAVAALLLLSILIPSMLPGNEDSIKPAMESSMDLADGDDSSSESESLMKSSERTEEAETSEVVEDAAASEQIITYGDSARSYVLTPEELDRTRTFRVGLTHAANIIPVTFLIPEDRFTSDFPDGEPNSIELYSKYAAEIPEEELGFDEYHPYSGNLSVENDVIVHEVSKGHNYDRSAASLGVYYGTIDETFYDFDKFKTVDGNGDFAEFDYIGLTEIKSLPKGKRPLPYYKYVKSSGESYLIPDGGSSFDSVEDALLAMKEAPNDLVESLIPGSIDFDVQVIDGGGVAVITFKEQLDSSKINTDDLNAMIEGFMLTAQNFHTLVRLENVLQEQFGKYDLTSNLPEPVAVNPLYLSN
ncbi:hypothetical protein ACXYMX_06790 [Sporosarcina sp. CAU 1771]